MNTIWKIVKSFWSKNPPYLIWFSTAQCNSRCRHCFYWKNIKDSNVAKELQLWEIDEIARKYGGLLYLSIGGGEPFLRNDLPEICRAFYTHTGVPFITLTTNGLLSDKIQREVVRALEFCPGTHFTIPLSIDGVREKHDELRGVNGNFRKIMDTYKNIVALKEQSFNNVDVDVNTVVSTYNENEIENIFEFVEKEMPRIRNHGICFARGNTKEENAKHVPIERLKELRDFIEMKKRKKDATDMHPGKGKSFMGHLFDSISSMTNDIGLEVLQSGQMPLQCLAGKRLVEISEIGTVFPCELLDTNIGNIRDYDYDVARMLKTKTARKIQKTINDGECACTFECAEAVSIAYNPLTYFKLIGKAINSMRP